VTWPLLADVALTWGDMPVSSICGERAFAQPRMIDVPHAAAEPDMGDLLHGNVLRVSLIEKKFAVMK
jgi:hypothetical protein